MLYGTAAAILVLAAAGEALYPGVAASAIAPQLLAACAAAGCGLSLLEDTAPPRSLFRRIANATFWIAVAALAAWGASVAVAGLDAALRPWFAASAAAITLLAAFSPYSEPYTER